MLQPIDSARLADDIYLIKDKNGIELFTDLYSDKLSLNKESAQTLKGKTGAFVFLKSERPIGIAACGINKLNGHAVVALKGTTNGYDVLTDLNAGIKRFHTGGLVHQGFYYTFLSFLPQLEKFIQDLPSNVHTIHCVGHSLGGALATLSADWLASNSSKSIKLYTYGSPRVGLDYFANGCKRRINEHNIYRVYHHSDPVVMVPTWPFVHVPDGGQGDLMLPSPDSLNPAQHHKMNKYIASVAPNDVGLGWEELRKRRPSPYLEQSLQTWLKSDSVISLTMNTVWLAGEALLWVLRKIGNLAGIAVVVSGGTTFTLLDRLAIFMHKAYQISKDISFWVLRLIKRLAQLIGIRVSDNENITVAFIRMVFLRLHRAVSDLVKRAGRMVN